MASPQRPHWGAYSTPPDPLAVFRGPTSKGKGRREDGKGRGGEGVRPLTSEERRKSANMIALSLQESCKLCRRSRRVGDELVRRSPGVQRLLNVAAAVLNAMKHLVVGVLDHLGGRGIRLCNER